VSDDDLIRDQREFLDYLEVKTDKMYDEKETLLKQKASLVAALKELLAARVSEYEEFGGIDALCHAARAALRDAKGE